MKIVEHDGGIRIEHTARAGFVKYMGYISLFVLLPVSVLMFFVKLYEPDTVTLHCDRAAAQCTVSPVSAGWSPRTFELTALSTIRADGRDDDRLLWVREANGHDVQLSQHAYGRGAAARYEEIVAVARTFGEGDAPALDLTYPAGEDTMGWPQVVITFLFGAVWVVPFFRAPRRLELEIDTRRRAVVVRRRFWHRIDEQSHAITEARSIRLAGVYRGAKMVSVTLVLEGDEQLVLFDEAAFSVARSDAEALAERLSTALGVAIERG